MQTSLIAVGNSKGLRLPKALLTQCGIEDRVCLKVTGEGLLVSPVRSPRQGWEEAIKAEHRSMDKEAASFVDLGTAFDCEDWTWPDPNS